MADLAEGEKLPVYIWTQDIDHEAVELHVQQETGLTIDSIQLDVQTTALDTVKATSLEQADAQLTAVMERNEAVLIQKQVLTDTYMTARRNEYKSQYLAENAETLQALEVEEKDILFRSKYSPMNIVELSAEEIAKAAQSSAVVSLGLCEEVTVINDSLASSMETVEADLSSTVLTGNGIKVGMIEKAVPDVNDSDLDGKVTSLGGTTTSNAIDIDHATEVAEIIHAVAPDAQIYAIGTGSPIYISVFMDYVETLIDYDVSVINMSAGITRTDSNWYTTLEQWLDHISLTHGVTFVKSAGNLNDNPSGNISEPGMAYNIITVGAIHDNHTGNVLTDDSLSSETCTGNGGSNGCAKPDVMAPGTGDGTKAWTSNAAPIVTGLIAQMMEYDATLKARPCAVKAIICACCDRKVSGGSSNETMAQGITAEQGCGVVNAMHMCAILINENYVSGNFTTSRTEMVAISSPLMITATWLRKNTVYETNGSWTTTTADYQDVDLYVYSSNYSRMASELTISSTEMIYRETVITGDYGVQLFHDSDDDTTPSIPFGLAWY